MLARALTIVLVVLLGVTGCEKPTHQNIDKWVTTQKGPGKLKAALADAGLDPDLSAHAAVAMLKRRDMMDADVRAALDKMSGPRRAQVIPKLAPRLWDVARVESETDIPDSLQATAKDLLVKIREWADDPTKQQIDAYLTDWYGVRSYVARAKAGAVSGEQVVRVVGAPLGAKLVGVAQSVIAAPGQEVEKNKLDDTLLIGIAIAGTPEGVKFILDLVSFDRGDKTLPERAVSALYQAYVNSDNQWDLQQPTALRPNVDALAGIAKQEGMSGQAVNDALALIRATGSPTCKAPLESLISYPHPEVIFKYAVAAAELACVGPSSIGEVVKAFPEGAHEQVLVMDNLVREIAKQTPPEQVLPAVRALLNESGTFPKWVAIETLAFLKSKADLPAIAALAKSKEPLQGYWGDNPENKPTPTLGQRASELAATLK